MSHSPLRLLLKYRNLNHRLSAVVGNKDITRTIFAYAKGRRIYILRTFIKKTPKTPPTEIKLALQRLEEMTDES
ncbi:hypothetical protein GPY51_16245 [Photorhabdus laumondii subsp. laumondii]|uniref:Addiction module toxin RelE n=1 Tax=Photorhabdus laumondii subsp. laumondii TaxID=141679 RepID=A0A6L9JLX2_PHOLM|nr:hypothetical protein A4R40_04495 [Photorhabdus laumondii subsp. laumondii]MCC8383056.1 type II toxin-antitoxin system RelE/ParE family toxin [Photorhabdus laumondii]RAW74308.1 hypothetical protein CKY15_03410 [Photorhabdus sp. S7-51]RAW76146.1 hypothetical protein CKY14_02095 [Photorhabdus sp. S14-60]RAW79751.1 hypothetical protein CKY06_02930 [Photorhabdus sp. S15-56]RAW87616.1 hypothetical protein CKY09_06160 [Photorhabdus sp. S5P8-50]RAW88297.1 hypothetical protein CKY12_04610 [Photorha